MSIPAPFDRNADRDPVRLRRAMQVARRDVPTIQTVEQMIDARSADDGSLRWVSFQVPYTLFNEAATSSQRTIWSMPPRTVVMHAVYRSVRAFTGPSLSSASLFINNFAAADAGPSLGASTSIDVFSAPKEDYSSPVTMYHASLLAIVRRDVEVPFDVTLSLAGCNCDQLTDGLAEIALLTNRYP